MSKKTLNQLMTWYEDKMAGKKTSPLERAVQEADETQIKNLLMENTLEEQQGYDLLCEAVDQGQANVAELLLKAGAPGHRAAATRLPPLVLTAYRNDLHLVRLLLRLGGTHSDEVLQEALFEAVVNGHDEAAALLVEAGTPVEHSSEAPFDALAACCSRQCLRTARALLNRGVPGHALQRALREALSKGQDDAAALLLQHGASLGHLAHEAAGRGCYKTLAIGISRGIIPGISGRHTLLHSAAQGFARQLCSVTKFFQTVDLLLDSGAQINSRDGLGRTALITGLLDSPESADEFVSGMISRGADPRVHDTFGTTPAHVAAEEGQADALMKIIDAGGRVDAADWCGKRPLHVSAANTVPVLLKYFADLDAADNRGVKTYCCVKEAALQDPHVSRDVFVHLQALRLAGLPRPETWFPDGSPYSIAAGILNATELEYMKKARVLNVTYYDFIRSTPHKLVKPALRKALLKEALAVEARDIFPCYAGLWIKRVRQLEDKIYRDELVEKSSCLLSELIDMNLPTVVLDNIFKYLSDEDLEKFTSRDQYNN